MDNYLEYSSEVRKKILSMLMFQLYSDERTIYREYVQNALDSINKAVEEHVLSQAKDGVVSINIDAKHKVIKIRDNGAGIEFDNAVRILLDISPSTKDGINQAGMYGIGRLVGGGYCHELVFRTSARGESIGTQIIFDVDKIWKMIEEDKEDYLATHVINECTTKESIPAEKSDHFFEVVLNGVKDEAAPSLLDSDAVIDYLREIAPVEYKPEFKNTLIYRSTMDNPEFKFLHENLEKVQVFVGDVRIQKQYGLSIRGTKDCINNLEYFKIETPEYGMLGWGWYALTKYTIQIPKDDKLAGIRLRAHNIQVGDSTLLSNTKYWKEERGNYYFYGEFFVTHSNIRPNGARDGLVPTLETNALNNGLRTYFENLKNLYYKANEAKKCIDRIKEGIRRIDEKAGIADYNAIDLINNRGIGKFEKLMGSTYGFAAVKKMLFLYQQNYLVEKGKGEEKLKISEKLKQTGSEKGSKIKEVLNTDISKEVKVDSDKNASSSKPEVSEKLSPSIPAYPPIHNNSKTSTVSEPLEYKRGEIHPLHESVSTPLIGKKDILAPLNGILEQNEVWILRRVFRVLNLYCPNNEHDQKLINEIEEQIVKEFSNEK